MSPSEGFLDRQRLLKGTWQSFERDVARLMLHHGFQDVRIVGGSGDHGGDVLGTQDGQKWVFQCKHTTSSGPPVSAIKEVIEAGRYYSADRLVIAVSRPPGEGFRSELARQRKVGLKVETATPAHLLRLMAEAPEYAPSRRNLRDYQNDAAERLRESLTDTGRGQIVMATGLGKTVVIAETLADLLRDGLVKNNRVLVLAHTRELVEQLHLNFWHQLPKWVRTEALTGAERPVLWDGIVFATIQSAASQIDALPEFGLVIVDEAHHIGAPIFRKVIDALNPTMIAGATATPWRGDGYDIDRLIGPPVVQIGIAEGLQKGFLADVDYRLCADDLNWEMVQDRSVHGYSISQLNRRLIIPTRDDEAARMINETFESTARRAGIVFCPSVVHAESIAAALRRFGLRAESISAQMSPRERDQVMSRFRSGDLHLVTTVDLFNEGVDVPDVDLVVFMRATHSRRIFVQQLGRGLRISPSKEQVIVLDFVTDLRRVAEVIQLDQAARDQPIERLGLGSQLISFRDASAGDFLREWMLDQASLILREGDHELELPKFEFPEPPPPGGVQ